MNGVALYNNHSNVERGLFIYHIYMMEDCFYGVFREQTPHGLDTPLPLSKLFKNRQKALRSNPMNIKEISDTFGS